MRTKSSIIAEKILPHLDSDYINGKRSPDDFKFLLKRLELQKILTSDDYMYIKKNFNRILIELRLFHFLPEIWSEDNTERVFRQVTAVLANRMLQKRRFRTKKQVSEHLKGLVDEVVTSQFDEDIGKENYGSYYRRIVNQLLDEAKSEKEDAEILALIIQEHKERLIELPKMNHALIYQLDRLARKIRRGEIDMEEGIQQLEELLRSSIIMRS